eukprot:1159813-Pelagomonas_calceolata.AAC.25
MVFERMTEPVLLQLGMHAQHWQWAVKARSLLIFKPCAGNTARSLHLQLKTNTHSKGGTGAQTRVPCKQTTLA